MKMQASKNDGLQRAYIKMTTVWYAKSKMSSETRVRIWYSITIKNVVEKTLGGYKKTVTGQP